MKTTKAAKAKSNTKTKPLNPGFIELAEYNGARIEYDKNGGEFVVCATHPEIKALEQSDLGVRYTDSTLAEKYFVALALWAVTVDLRINCQTPGRLERNGVDEAEEDARAKALALQANGLE